MTKKFLHKFLGSNIPSLTQSDISDLLLNYSAILPVGSLLRNATEGNRREVFSGNSFLEDVEGIPTYLVDASFAADAPLLRKYTTVAAASADAPEGASIVISSSITAGKFGTHTEGNITLKPGQRILSGDTVLCAEIVTLYSGCWIHIPGLEIIQIRVESVTPSDIDIIKDVEIVTGVINVWGDRDPLDGETSVIRFSSSTAWVSGCRLDIGCVTLFGTAGQEFDNFLLTKYLPVDARIGSLVSWIYATSCSFSFSLGCIAAQALDMDLGTYTPMDNATYTNITFIKICSSTGNFENGQFNYRAFGLLIGPAFISFDLTGTNLVMNDNFLNNCLFDSDFVGNPSGLDLVLAARYTDMTFDITPDPVYITRRVQASKVNARVDLGVDVQNTNFIFSLAKADVSVGVPGMFNNDITVNMVSFRNHASRIAYISFKNFTASRIHVITSSAYAAESVNMLLDNCYLCNASHSSYVLDTVGTATHRIVVNAGFKNEVTSLVASELGAYPVNNKLSVILDGSTRNNCIRNTDAASINITAGCINNRFTGCNWTTMTNAGGSSNVYYKSDNPEASSAQDLPVTSTGLSSLLVNPGDLLARGNTEIVAIAKSSGSLGDVFTITDEGAGVLGVGWAAPSAGGSGNVAFVYLGATGLHNYDNLDDALTTEPDGTTFIISEETVKHYWSLTSAIAKKNITLIALSWVGRPTINFSNSLTLTKCYLDNFKFVFDSTSVIDPGTVTLSQCSGTLVDFLNDNATLHYDLLLEYCRINTLTLDSTAALQYPRLDANKCEFDVLVVQDDTLSIASLVDTYVKDLQINSCNTLRVRNCLVSTASVYTGALSLSYSNILQNFNLYLTSQDTTDPGLTSEEIASFLSFSNTLPSVLNITLLDDGELTHTGLTGKTSLLRFLNTNPVHGLNLSLHSAASAAQFVSSVYDFNATFCIMSVYPSVSIPGSFKDSKFHFTTESGSSWRWGEGDWFQTTSPSYMVNRAVFGPGCEVFFEDLFVHTSNSISTGIPFYQVAGTLTGITFLTNAKLRIGTLHVHQHETSIGSKSIAISDGTVTESDIVIDEFIIIAGIAASTVAVVLMDSLRSNFHFNRVYGDKITLTIGGTYGSTNFSYNQVEVRETGTPGASKVALVVGGAVQTYFNNLLLNGADFSTANVVSGANGNNIKDLLVNTSLTVAAGAVMTVFENYRDISASFTNAGTLTKFIQALPEKFGAGTSRYLREDGTFATPPGGSGAAAYQDNFIIAEWVDGTTEYTLNIPHGLGNSYPMVQVWDDDLGEQVIVDVRTVSVNEIQLAVAYDVNLLFNGHVMVVAL